MEYGILIQISRICFQSLLRCFLDSNDIFGRLSLLIIAFLMSLSDNMAEKNWFVAYFTKIVNYDYSDSWILNMVDHAIVTGIFTHYGYTFLHHEHVH
jgi:hypothetical protein